MIIYPAIDLKGGKCVRLIQGDMSQSTVYGDDPAAMAASFQSKGAQWLHVVDLDGAFAGDSANLPAIAAILGAVGIPVELGGGLRSMAQLERVFSLGISRAILGTAALQDPPFVKEAVGAYGGKIAVGIDAKGGKVAVNGWAQETEMTPKELALRVRDAGVTTLIYTDISRDGMLTGPNFESTQQLIRDTGMEIIVSGGVGGIDHVRQAAGIGAAGIIIGKAIYTGAVDIAEAIAVGGAPC